MGRQAMDSVKKTRPATDRNLLRVFLFRLRGAGRSRTDDGGFAIRCLSHLATAPCSGWASCSGCESTESY